MPRKLCSTRRCSALVLLLLSAMCTTTLAGPGQVDLELQPEQPEPVSPSPPPIAPDWVAVDEAENTGLWFIEFATAPTVEGGELTDLHADKERFRAAARQRGLAVKERFAFDVLWNGLSVEIDLKDLGKISRLPGVVAVYPVDTVTADPVLENSVGMVTSLEMIGANVAQNDLGIQGTGVRVGIIDSGIDYDHPDLGGCFGPGCRVEVGWDYVGDDYAGPSSLAVPDADPDDCMGHGTHVAGIVGANGTVMGVAPEVTLGAYRVFGCEGNTTTDLMIAAMEQALADGMDIVNMSIGSARQWPQYPSAIAGTRLVNAGVVVAASFGNKADQGLYGAGAPGIGDKVIGVASAINTHLRLPTFEAEGRDIAYDVMGNADAPPTIGTEPMVYVGRGCGGDPMENVPTGRVALLERGGCTFREKAWLAMVNGATAVVIHNNRYGVVFGTLGAPALPWEVVGISQEDGLYLRSLESPLFNWTDRVTPGALTLGGLISSFSSHGLSPDLQLKPDLTAPGGFIYSTYPLEKGGHATLSGTSMASPHVAGAAALLLEAHPHTPAQIVGEILQNNSNPFANRSGSAAGIPESVHRQGAGMADIAAAITADVKITPGKLSLGESEHGPAIRTLMVENRGEEELVYDLSHQPALATEGTIDLTYLDAGAAVTFEPSTVTVPPSGTVSVSVTIEAPTAPRAVQYGGYLVFAGRDGGQTYRVPYAGFAGDYQSIQVLSDTPQGFPWLAKWVNDRYYNRPYGAAYTLQDNDRPFFLVHLDHQVRRLRFEVFDAVTGQSWHRAREFDYFQRNTGHINWWSFSWDGFTRHGNSVVEVPNGSYRVRLAVQKALGEDDNPDHWEYWDSPVVTILRPEQGANREAGAAVTDEELSAPQQDSSRSTKGGSD